MSHYKPYPAYKDSGVERLGQVPEHWDTQRIRTLIDSAQNGIWGDDPDGGADDIPCARVADFDRNSFTVKGELPTLRKVPEAQRLSRQVNPGDLLIEKSGGGEQTTVGVVVQYQGGQPVICSNFVAVVKPKKGVFPRWLCYTNAHLYSVGVNVRSIKQTTGIQNIDSDQYFSERVAVPPESERQAISAHLDRETARIDALIEKKTRFIELLREKRQALITHAVTKGLDPSAKMKDSGVEWLGEVPEHWAVCKLSFRYSVELGKMLDEKRITSTSLMPYLRNQDVQWDAVNAEDLPEMDIHPEELSRYTVRAGDLLVCEGGDVGRAAIWRGENEVIGYQKALHRLRPRDATADTTEFFFFALMAAKTRGVFEESDSKATIAHLPAEKFRQYRFAFPPAHEQLEIAGHIRTHAQRLDKVQLETERSIALLKERRSALITAAVTGQIDLRETV